MSSTYSFSPQALHQNKSATKHDAKSTSRPQIQGRQDPYIWYIWFLYSLDKIGALQKAFDEGKESWEVNDIFGEPEENTAWGAAS